MKKQLTYALAACLLAVYSCGPSAEEKAAAEKARQDSVAAVAAEEARKAAEDSMMQVQKAMEDSMKMKAMEDSMAMMKDAADKAASKPKPKPKTNQQKEKEDRKTLENQKG